VGMTVWTMEASSAASSRPRPPQPAGPPLAVLGSIGRGLQDAAIRARPRTGGWLRSVEDGGGAKRKQGQLHPRAVEEILWITGRERRPGTKDGRLPKFGTGIVPSRAVISQCTLPKNRGAGGNPNDRGLPRERSTAGENAGMEYPVRINDLLTQNRISILNMVVTVLSNRKIES
jgi:hypothetical protein